METDVAVRLGAAPQERTPERTGVVSRGRCDHHSGAGIVAVPPRSPVGVLGVPPKGRGLTEARSRQIEGLLPRMVESDLATRQLQEVTGSVVWYLDATAVRAAMPSLDDQFSIADRALRGVASGAQVPGKRTVHPEPEASFAYAMAAYDPGLGRGREALGVKWVTGYPTNSKMGLPTINSLVVLNDPDSLRPIAILDGTQITAARTAAVSAVCIRQLAIATGRPVSTAILGAGVQGHAHLAVLGHVLPGVRIVTFDRHRDRAVQLASAAQDTPGIASAKAAPSAREAVRGADIVITAASFGPVKQVMTTDWLKQDVLIVSVDYETYVSAEIARSAAVFLVDELEGYQNVRTDGRFVGFPDPSGTIGEALAAGLSWTAGRVLVCHLGIGLTDVLFADTILQRALDIGVGIEIDH